MAELCVAYKNRGVVGFDLAGAEYNYPAKDHKQAFQLILDNNINCTAHAGEAYGPESIAQAIHYCGAHRIGHGTRLRENGDLLNYVNDHRIPLEICLSSNVQTRAVPDLATHPLPFYFNYGLRVTINTDNRLDHRHDRVEGAPPRHQHYGFGARRHQGDHHRRLQERVPAVPREGRRAEGDHQGARGVRQLPANGQVAAAPTPPRELVEGGCATAAPMAPAAPGQPVTEPRSSSPV